MAENDHQLATRLAEQAGSLLTALREEMWQRGAHPWQVMDTGDISAHRFLMEELRKVKRVIGKADATAPHETWLVLDANTAVSQGQDLANFLRHIAYKAAVAATSLAHALRILLGRH